MGRRNNTNGVANDRSSLEIFTSNFLDEMYDFENQVLVQAHQGCK